MLFWAGLMSRLGKVMADEAVLYHYTDSNGLLGILDCKQFWATDFRFLNDGKEIYYGIDILLECLLCEPNSGGLRGLFLKRLKEKVEAVRSNIEKSIDFRAYVACFCSDGDLLSQWRGYANYGAGYSIGFSRKFLGEISGCRLLAVEYDGERQRQRYREAINRKIDQIMGAAQSGLVDDEKVVSSAIVDLFRECLIFYFCSFKGHAFSEESEWRLLFIRVGDGGGEKVCFRPSKYGVTPYVKIELDGACIGAVKVGPGFDFSLNKQAINLLAANNGLSLVVSQSDIPFR